MKIAVTGASGFLGSHLLPKLVEHGHEVVALVRQKSSRAKLMSQNFPLFPVDFDLSSSIASAIQGCDTVIHLLGVINGSEALLKRANIEITDHLIEACKTAKIERIIHMSSVAATMGHGPYGRSKAQGEALVRQSGIPCVIFQPAYIYGSGDLNLTQRMTRVLKYSPIVPVLGGGSFKIQPVHVDDICQAMIQAIDQNMENETFILAGPDQVSLKDMLHMMANAMKVRRIFLPIPLKGVQSLIRVFLKIFPSTRLPLKQILELDKHQAFDISHARTRLGFEPIPFSVGVKKMFGESSCAA